MAELQRIIRKVVNFIIVFCLIIFQSTSNINIVFAENYEEDIQKNIEKYYTKINEKDYSNLYDLFSETYYNETKCVYENETNKKNHVGIFDIKSAKIKSLTRENDLTNFELDTYDTTVACVYKVIVDMDVYTGKDCFQKGTNICYFLFDFNKKMMACWNFEDKFNDIAMMTSYDTPIADIHNNPTTIKILHNGEIISRGFKEYVKVVEKCEVGYPNWNKEALKACAVAIKNYGIVRVKRHKYAGQGYDVKDTEVDQVYQPKSKSDIAICNEAVDDVWNVIWLDADRKVFPGFHVHSEKISSYAVHNGGILSQTGAQNLAQNRGYDWVNILRYYYDRKKGVSYYNGDVAIGTTTFVHCYK